MNIRQLEGGGQNVDSQVDHELASGMTKVALTDVALRPKGVEKGLALEPAHTVSKDPSLVPPLSSDLMAKPDFDSDSQSEPFHKIFVGGITWNTTDETITKLFSRFGTVIEAAVMRDRTNGASRGFGFVTFQEPEAVTAVLSEPIMLEDRRLDCKLAVPKGGCKSSQHVRKVFVGGLTPQTTANTLRTHFSQFGNVINAVVMLDHATGRSRGFGFVTFSSEQAVDALMLKPQYVGGSLVECRKAVSKQRQMRLAKHKELKNRDSARSKNVARGANSTLGINSQLGIPRTGSYPPPDLFSLDALAPTSNPMSPFPVMSLSYLPLTTYPAEVYNPSGNPASTILARYDASQGAQMNPQYSATTYTDTTQMYFPPRQPAAANPTDYYQSAISVPALASPADMAAMNIFHFPVPRTSSRGGISRSGSLGPQQAQPGRPPARPFPLGEKSQMGLERANGARAVSGIPLAKSTVYLPMRL